VAGSLGRGKRILKPRFGEYPLKRNFLDLRFLVEKWLRCNLCGV